VDVNLKCDYFCEKTRRWFKKYKTS